ncbi:MAG: hypothetical protein SGI77_00210 [Pirellulaceae bacterium]|nr:hypothetical protein [Pirellulaceae bacterium]
MSVELLYTSAPQGLKQGSRGFCTVLSTAGMPINLAQRLESLSGYRQVYPPQDVKAADNPICFSHLRLTLGGRTVSILSRLCAFGIDYSQRTNKLAHHVVLDPSEQIAAGPAIVLNQPGVIRTKWSGQCETLAVGPRIIVEDSQPAICETWHLVAGDAGWAGILAEAWSQPTSKTLWIIFSESQSNQLLTMLGEAIALLPVNRRWNATFSTYYTSLPPDIDCRVRCVLKGTDEARMAISRGTVIDLTKPMTALPNTPAIQAARDGDVIGQTAPTSSTPPSLALSPPLTVAESASEKAFFALSSKDNANDLRLAPEQQKKPPTFATPNARLGTRLEDSDDYHSKKSRFAMRSALAVAACLVVIGAIGMAAYLARNPKNGVVVGNGEPKSNGNSENITSHEPNPPSGEPSSAPPSETKVSGEQPSVTGATPSNHVAEPPKQDPTTASEPKQEPPINILIEPPIKNVNTNGTNAEVKAKYPEIVGDNPKLTEDLRIAEIVASNTSEQIQIDNTVPFKIEQIDGQSWLILKKGARLDFETNKQISAVISVGQSSKTFILMLTDLDDPPKETVSVTGKARDGETISATFNISDQDGIKSKQGRWEDSLTNELSEWKDLNDGEILTKEIDLTLVGKQIQYAVQYETKGFGKDVSLTLKTKRSEPTLIILSRSIGSIKFNDLLALKENGGGLKVSIDVPVPISEPITNGNFTLGPFKGTPTTSGLNLSDESKKIYFEGAKFVTKNSETCIQFSSIFPWRQDVSEKKSVASVINSDNGLFKFNGTPAQTEPLRVFLKTKFDLDTQLKHFHDLLSKSQKARPLAVQDMIRNFPEALPSYVRGKKGEGLVDLYESIFYADIIFDPLKKYNEQMNVYRKKLNEFEESKNKNREEPPKEPSLWNSIDDFPVAEWKGLSKAIKIAKSAKPQDPTAEVMSLMNTNVPGSTSLSDEWKKLSKLLNDFREKTEPLVTFNPLFDAQYRLEITKYRINDKLVEEPLAIDISFKVQIEVKSILKDIDAITKRKW